MLAYTKNNLQKIETLFDEIGYDVRYEKGNFQSGYCLVEHKKIAVVNKFFETEGRINALLEILDRVGVEEEDLSESSQKLWKQIQKNSKHEEEKT